VGTVVADERPLLLDTVAFVLWHQDSPALSPKARAAMLQALQRPIFVSAATAFEIATKVRIGKLSVPAAMLSDFVYVVESDGFRMLDVDAMAAIRAGQLPADHRDPFDRLLAAQAVANGCAIVTNDRMFVSLGAEVFW
jgi:PIN domain nuclease of toxin-antitoxin system